MKAELRLSDTNAASDSSGRTWGLEGNLVWWLVGGLGGGIAVFFVLVVWLDVALVPSIGLTAVPVGLVLAYVFGLRQGRPPGYDRDLLESLVGGRGFSPDPERPRCFAFPGAPKR